MRKMLGPALFLSTCQRYKNLVLVRPCSNINNNNNAMFRVTVSARLPGSMAH